MHKQFYKLQELLEYVQKSAGGEHKGIFEIGETTASLAARIQQTVGVNAHQFRLTLDNYGIRHAFEGHSQERGSQDQHPLTEADVLALPGWAFEPEVIEAGNDQSTPNQLVRLQFEILDSQRLVKTVVIWEVRPRHRRLVLVTMYKTKNG